VKLFNPARNGYELSRQKVFYTNGKETSRINEGSSVIKNPVKQITNVGSKAVVRSVDIGSQSLDYYRMEEVYVTSYSPCRQGYPDCRKSTASGTPLAKGVIAVTPQWYRIFAGTQIYIPGYGVGTVADTGGGIPGKYWIDLGYSEEDFVNWHQTSQCISSIRLPQTSRGASLTIQQPDYISLMKRFNIQPRKSLGQNFLLDASILNQIVQSAGE
jgi:3D (Asp-Asp-Asp) domain-containing protein